MKSVYRNAEWRPLQIAAPRRGDCARQFIARARAADISRQYAVLMLDAPQNCRAASQQRVTVQPTHT